MVGRESGHPDSVPSSPVNTATLKQDLLLLTFCLIGLQGSYLTWGILQEKVITQVSFIVGQLKRPIGESILCFPF